MTRVVALVERGRALEVALGLGEVTALALAPPDGEAALRAARVAGAKRAVAVWDESLRDTDYYGAAQALACAIRRLEADIIVCSDGQCGLLGPALADRLGAPHLSAVVSAELRDGRVVASRPAGGRLYLMSAAPPVVLGVIGSAPPPHVSEPVEIERLSIGEIGIAPAELRWRRRFAPTRPVDQSHGPAARPMLFSDVKALVERLRAEGLIGRSGAGK